MNVNNEKKGQSNLHREVLYLKSVSHGATGKRHTGVSTTVLISINNQIGMSKGAAAIAKNAIEQAVHRASKDMTTYSFCNRTTIPFEVEGRYHSSRIIMKPAVEGHGIRAGSIVRSFMNCLKIRNIISKRYGSNNKRTMALAVKNGLDKIEKLLSVFNIRRELKKNDNGGEL